MGGLLLSKRTCKRRAETDAAYSSHEAEALDSRSQHFAANKRD